MDGPQVPDGLPASIVAAIGEARVASVTEEARGLRVYALAARDGWPLRVLKVAPPGDPFAALAEVDRLDWIDRRLPCPKLLASSPLPGGGHAVVLSLPVGTSAAAPDHPMGPSGVVTQVAQALRFVHEVQIETCPFDMRADLRLRAIRRRLNSGVFDSTTFAPPYSRSSPHRLYELLVEAKPADDDPVFTHGAFGMGSVLLDANGISGIVDWQRAGIADRYVDLARAARSVADTVGAEHVPRFFASYGIEHPHPGKLDFYGLLAEFD